MEQQHVEYLKKIKNHLRSAYLLSDEKIEAVLPRFVDTVRKLMSDLNELAVTDKNDALSRAGHAMKGALLNLGLQELAEKAYSIEKHQLVCNSDRDCVQLVVELKQEIDKII